VVVAAWRWHLLCGGLQKAKQQHTQQWREGWWWWQHGVGILQAAAEATQQHAHQQKGRVPVVVAVVVAATPEVAARQCTAWLTAITLLSPQSRRRVCSYSSWCAAHLMGSASEACPVQARSLPHVLQQAIHVAVSTACQWCSQQAGCCPWDVC
jgi:hypothetical protein